MEELDKQQIFQLVTEFLKNSNDNDLKVLEVGCGKGKLAHDLREKNIINSIDCINYEGGFCKGPKWEFKEKNKKENLHFEIKQFLDVTKKYNRVFSINSFQFLFDDDSGNLDFDKIDLDKIMQVESKLHDILLSGGKAFIYTSSCEWFKQHNKPFVARKVLYSMKALNYFTKFDIDNNKLASNDQMITILTKRE